MKHLSVKSTFSIAALSVLLMSCGDGSKDAAESSGNSENTSVASTGAPAALEADVAAVEADILGVRLGMTPDEAEAALNENKPDNVRLLPLTWSSFDPDHSSGWPPIKADTPGAFVTGLRAIGPGNTHEIQISFAKPPADNLVESIYRKEHYSSLSDRQTSLEVYRQFLIDKYGPPTEEDKAGAILLLKWLYPSGAADCAPLKSNLPAKRQASSYPDDMGHPPEKCATALIYSLTFNGGIVNNMEAKLVNPGQEYFHRKAAMAYQADLRRKAEEAKRQKATNAPDL
tara:strand:- start:13684 stop:14541 length:858 start_codon:yes stop_codon:yes gene_type:complete